MPLAGDIIVAAREQMPDAPGTLAAPVAAGYTPSAVAVTGATLPAATYTVSLSYINPWGETTTVTLSPNVAITAGQGIQIASSIGLPPGVTAARAYFQPTNYPAQYQEITAFPATISALGTTQPMPTRSTAWLPDTDGGRISAATIYRWLKEALEAASLIVGGIPDTTGISTVAGQGSYVVPGSWLLFEKLWYNGWPGRFGDHNEVFYHNNVKGISNLAVMNSNAERSIIEVWPQCDSAGGSGTLLSAMTLAGSQAIASITVSFQLPFGMAMLGGSEIVSFQSIANGTISGLVRGLAGTTPQAWAQNTTVAELNLRLFGRRFGYPVAVGSSAVSLPIPPGWQGPLAAYIIAQQRAADQDLAGSKELLAKFEGALRAYQMTTLREPGPRQNPAYGWSDGGPVYDDGFGGGLIVP